MEIPNCYICEKLTFVDTSYTFKCKNCDAHISNLEPGFGREVEGIDELRRKNFQKIISKILLFGSGKGIFIEECEKLKIDIVGSEPDENQYQFLKSKYRNILKISLPLNEDKKDLINQFDYIIFNDVFEHLKKLDIILNQLKKYLKNDGCIIFNIPSSNGFIFNTSRFFYKIGVKIFYDRLWQKNTSSPHMTYFNKKSLPMLLDKYNYELIDTDSLDFIGKKGNYKRLNSLNSNKLFCVSISLMLYLLYFFQKILPKDVLLQIYKINKK